MAEKKEGKQASAEACLLSGRHLVINCSRPMEAEPRKAKVRAEDKAGRSSLGPLLFASLLVISR